MTQQERQERSRRIILQAAIEEFGTEGYETVTMERICGKHKISKGMMYHYYTGKDDLYLLCVEDTFTQLHAYIQQKVPLLDGRLPDERIKPFFLLREDYFQQHPQQQVIFESAVLRPPSHLVRQIEALHAPLRELNRRFLADIVAHAPLRPGLTGDQVMRYLECVGSGLVSRAGQYQSQQGGGDLHSLLRAAGELLDMALFGVLRQTDSPPSDGKTFIRRP